MLAPLSYLTGRIAGAKRGRINQRRRDNQQKDAPPDPIVIVIGNLVAGGAGKTPLTIALAAYLQKKSYRVGLICRGGPAGATNAVSLNSEPAENLDAGQIGDEARLLARATGLPVVIGHQRDKALSELTNQEPQLDIVISDDGLQHEPLRRDLELVVLDRRGLGNGRLLPAGPLREPASRLSQVDFLVANGGAWPGATTMHLVPGDLVRLRDGETLDAAAFRERYGAVHGVAGIGNPERFFRTLALLGLAVTPHAFADHHGFTAADLDFADGRPVIMTEKDAVKCRDFDDPRLWMLPVHANLPPATLDAMIDRALQSQPQ